MIEIDLTSDKVDEMIALLKHFPELADKYYRPVIKKDVSMIKGIIDIPHFTGRSIDTFGSKVTGRAFFIKGRAGWYDANDPHYIRMVDEGAQAHEIKAGRVSKRRFNAGKGGSKFLAIPGTYDGGNFSFRKVVKHPGIKARNFMAAAFSTVEPIVLSDIEQANENILAEYAAI